jgi:serine-aspartate repeat-containing protein C/D/E
VPDGYIVSDANQGDDDTKDSDANATGDVTEATINGEDNLTIDMGIYKKAAIGDRVWYDNDKDGIQDSGEEGVADVNVSLLDKDGNVIATTTTDSDGYYIFEDLVPDEYSIKFDLDTLPADYAVTAKDSGSDDSVDSDADTTTGQTESTTLDAGERDLTWDMGIYKPTYSLGDYVWNDTDKDGIQDPDEDGIEGVEVELLDSDGNSLGKTKTDDKGLYRFDDLENGDYQVRFSVPDDYIVSDTDQGSDDTKDSDANSKGEVSKATIAGADNMTIDMGIYKESNIVVNTSIEEAPTPKIPNIDIEKHTNGEDADVELEAVPLIEGDSITWEYIVTNTGDDVLTNIAVKDDKEGDIDCPRTSLSPGETMTCTKTGIADEPKYKNTATVTATGQTSDTKVEDNDSSWYTTKYIIGTHFWIDTNKDGIYQEDVEEPVPFALVELFDKDGNKIDETTTNEKGEYRFLVDAGTYYVKFHLPKEFKEKGYVFDSPVNNDDNYLNANNTNEQGITKLATVGPNADERFKLENLTLDAAINCGCDDPTIDQGSGNAFGKFATILMMIFTLLLALREIESSRLKG